MENLTIMHYLEIQNLEEYVVHAVDSTHDKVYGFHSCTKAYVNIICVILFMDYFLLIEFGKMPKMQLLKKTVLNWDLQIKSTLIRQVINKLDSQTGMSCKCHSYHIMKWCADKTPFSSQTLVFNETKSTHCAGSLIQMEILSLPGHVLKMEALCSSKTSVTLYHASWKNIPKKT
jgi:hypothetical protein